jgi:hypothetical protein
VEWLLEKRLQSSKTVLFCAVGAIGQETFRLCAKFNTSCTGCMYMSRVSEFCWILQVDGSPRAHSSCASIAVLLFPRLWARSGHVEIE